MFINVCQGARQLKATSPNTVPRNTVPRIEETVLATRWRKTINATEVEETIKAPEVEETVMA